MVGTLSASDRAICRGNPSPRRKLQARALPRDRRTLFRTIQRIVPIPSPDHSSQT